MKVGILTFHYMPNFGALYQSFGMQTVLRELGVEPIFINYLPKYTKKKISLLRGWGVRDNNKLTIDTKTPSKILGEIFRRRYDFSWRLKLSGFRADNLCTSPVLNNRQDLRDFSETLDAIVVGSDQLWNLNWQDEFDDTYFLGFLDNLPRKPRKICYGACFGQSRQPLDKLNKAVCLIKSFDFIGMRNQFGLDILGSRNVTNCKYVVDPAFFLTRYCKSVSDKKYNLIFFVDSRAKKQCVRLARWQAEQNGLPIKHIAAGSTTLLNEPDIESSFNSAPDDWLRAINSAEYFVSESFHGILFAIAQNTNFSAVSYPDRSERIQDVISRYSSIARFVSPDENLDFAELDFTKPHFDQQLLSADILSSKKFLSFALENL